MGVARVGVKHWESVKKLFNALVVVTKLVDYRKLVVSGSKEDERGVVLDIKLVA